MTEEVKMFFDEAKQHMDKAIAHLEDELTKVRAGKANPSMLNGIMVDYYGTMSPLHQISSISTPDARTLVIKPWEKSMLDPISKAIQASNIGLSPMNDGEIVRINIPSLTEERRKDMVKQIKGYSEHAKVSIRNARRDANEGIKSLQKEGVAEDIIKDGEQEVQHLTDSYITMVDKHIAKKEEEIMKV